MYILIDKKNSLIQCGLSCVSSARECFFEQIDPTFFAGNVERYLQSNLRWQTSFDLSPIRRIALRISWGDSFDATFLSSKRQHLFDGIHSHTLWNLDTLENCGTLPLSLGGQIHLRADSGCVRVDSIDGQHIGQVWRLLKLTEQYYVVTCKRHSYHAKKHRRVFLIASSTLSIIAAILLIRKNPTRSSQLIENFNQSAKVTSPASIASFSPAPSFTANPHISPSAVEESSPEFHLKNPNSDVTSRSQKRGRIVSDFDPLRCAPIEKVHRSKFLAQVAKNSLSREDWYVCR